MFFYITGLVIVVAVAFVASVGLLLTVAIVAWISSCCRRGQVGWTNHNKMRHVYTEVSTIYCHMPCPYLI